MRYEEILNRDMPTNKAHSQSWARQGVMAPIRIYYKHEAIAGQSTATNYDMEADGWKDSGIEIPANVEYSRYWSFLYQRLGSIPLFG